MTACSVRHLHVKPDRLRKKNPHWPGIHRLGPAQTADLPVSLECPNQMWVYNQLAGCSGVQIGPGATAFTRIPSETSERAMARVKLTIAPFVLE